MKLSIVLSQAECMKAGTSLQQQGAKDSLQMAYSTIQARSSISNAWLEGYENILAAQELDEQELFNDFEFNDILQTTDFDPGSTVWLGNQI